MFTVSYLMVKTVWVKDSELTLWSPVLSYLSSFWKVWSPSRSLKRKRGGSGGTSLSCCSILRVEMSKMTPLRSAWETLEEGGVKDSEKQEKGDDRGVGGMHEEQRDKTETRVPDRKGDLRNFRVSLVH